jgi:hypothetical protein
MKLIYESRHTKRTLYLVEIHTWTFARNVISFDMHCGCERESTRILHKFKLACAEEINLFCWYNGQSHSEFTVGERAALQPKTVH